MKLTESIESFCFYHGEDIEAVNSALISLLNYSPDTVLDVIKAQKTSDLFYTVKRYEEAKK